MKNTALRQLVWEFYRARLSRDLKKIANLLDDDVEWSISGPVDLIPFCGRRNGKEAVIDAIMHVAPSVITVTKLEFEDILVDGDRAAGFTTITAIQNSTRRVIRYQRADLLRFRDNKIIFYRAIMDSLDVAEQVLGHRIDLSEAATQGNAPINLIPV